MKTEWKCLEKFTHQNGKPCQVVCIAQDENTGKKMLVYQELSGDFSCKLMELEQFGEVAVSEEKTRISENKREGRQAQKLTELVKEREEAREVDEALLDFLDADTIAQKCDILSRMQNRINDHLIDSIAVSMDLVIPEGDIETRYQHLMFSLRTMQRYETQRLR